MAVSGIGASDIISATVGGALYGTSLIWALVLGVFFKFVLSEGLARWQLVTGTTLLQGWAKYLPRWVLTIFFIYLLLWAIAVSGALISACGLALENLSGGKISFTMAALGHAIAAFLFIALLEARRFGLVIKPLIVVMFLTVVVCAALTFPDAGALGKGLLLPRIPSGGAGFVFSLIGGIGGSLTLLNYNYLLIEEGRVGVNYLRAVRVDLALAYLFTAIFGLSIMLLATRVFYVPGIALTNEAAIPRMAGQLAGLLGPAGFYIYSLGFWAAVLASLLGVWQTVPHIFVDCWGLLRSRRNDAPGGARASYLIALAFMATAAVPFAFLQRPLFVVIAFTILGSLFIPFLAGTLLYLNNKLPSRETIGHNSSATNALLALIVLLFLVIGGWEILALAGLR
jgi:Mn2+/Fe2+ NRAMP family transporter